MNIRAESPRLAVSPGLTSPPPAALQVYGRDIDRYGASVSVKQNGQAIDDAGVVVNGVVLPLVLAEDGAYAGYFDAPLTAGDTVSLEVTRGAATTPRILRIRG